MLGEPDLQSALRALAELDSRIRERLVADGAVGLKHVFELEIAVEDAGTLKATLSESLAAQKRALDGEISQQTNELRMTRRRL